MLLSEVVTACGKGAFFAEGRWEVSVGETKKGLLLLRSSDLSFATGLSDQFLEGLNWCGALYSLCAL